MPVDKCMCPECESERIRDRVDEAKDEVIAAAREVVKMNSVWTSPISDLDDALAKLDCLVSR